MHLPAATGSSNLTEMTPSGLYCAPVVSAAAWACVAQGTHLEDLHRLHGPEPLALCCHLLLELLHEVHVCLRQCQLGEQARFALWLRAATAPLLSSLTLSSLALSLLQEPSKAKETTRKRT